MVAVVKTHRVTVVNGTIELMKQIEGIASRLFRKFLVFFKNNHTFQLKSFRCYVHNLIFGY